VVASTTSGLGCPVIRRSVTSLITGITQYNCPASSDTSCPTTSDNSVGCRKIAINAPALISNKEEITFTATAQGGSTLITEKIVFNKFYCTKDLIDLSELVNPVITDLFPTADAEKSFNSSNEIKIKISDTRCQIVGLKAKTLPSEVYQPGC
jgi:hypothetical protein